MKKIIAAVMEMYECRRKDMVHQVQRQYIYINMEMVEEDTHGGRYNSKMDVGKLIFCWTHMLA